MKMRLSLALVVACLAAAGWTIACGQTNPTVATPVGTATTTGLAVKGNTALTAPGQTTQLTLEATMSDGSRKDVTVGAQWFTSDSKVVTISPSGLATAVDFGKANVSGRAEGRSSNSVVLTVLPEGTYILAGRVSEAGNNLSVVGAQIQAVGGPDNGRVTTTNQSGAYAFKGVGGVVQVTASKDGYQPATRNVTGDTERIDVQMVPASPYASLGGVYSLTFTASPSCDLPDDARSRSYSATIDQRGAAMTIFLSDARFFSNNRLTWNQLLGRVLGNVVTFTLYEPYYCFYYGGCVAEQLGEGRYLTLLGTAQAVVTTPASMSAVFAGAVNVTAMPNGGRPTATCSASDHRLEFKRTG